MTTADNRDEMQPPETLAEEWVQAILKSPAERDGLDGYTRLVAMTLVADLRFEPPADVDRVETSLRTLARHASLVVNTVRDRLGRLERAGFLRVERGTTQRHVYRLTFPDDR